MSLDTSSPGDIIDCDSSFSPFLGVTIMPKDISTTDKFLEEQKALVEWLRETRRILRERTAVVWKREPFAYWTQMDYALEAHTVLRKLERETEREIEWELQQQREAAATAS